MKTRALRLFLLAAALAAATTVSEAAVVTLKDGGRLEGTVVSATANDVVLYTPQGAVRIESDRIASIDYSSGGPSPRLAPPPESGRRWRRTRPDDDLFGPRNQYVGLSLGMAAPLSDVNFGQIGGGSASNGDAGPSTDFQYMYLASPRVGAGVELNYIDRSETDTENLLPNSDAHVFGDSLLFLGELKIWLVDQGAPARPYLLVGAGGQRTTTTITARPNFGFDWTDTGTDERRTLVDGAAWGFASTLRAGVDFGFAAPSVFTVEAGWTALAGATYSATDAGRALGLSGVSGPINYFTLVARWGWTY